MKRVLCILISVLVMALPFTGLADSADNMIRGAIEDGKSVKVTYSVDLNPDLFGTDEQSAAIVELCNAITEVITCQKHQVTLSYRINDEEAVSGTLDLENSGLYVDSNFLEKPIVIDGTELIGLVKNYALPGLVSLGTISQEKADTFAGWIDQLIAGQIPEELQAIIDAAVGSLTEAILEDSETEEAAEEEPAVSLSATNTAMWAIGMMFSGEEVEVPENWAAASNAVAGTKFTVTRDDVIGLIDALAADLTDSTIPVLDEYAAANGTTADALVSAYADQIKTQLNAGGDFSVTSDSYYDEDGNVTAWSVSYTETGADGTVDSFDVICMANECKLEICSGNETQLSADITWSTETAEDGTESATAHCSLISGEVEYDLDFTGYRNETALPYGTAVVTLSQKMAGADDSTAATLGQVILEMVTASYDDIGEYDFDYNMVVSVLDTRVLTASMVFSTGDPVDYVATDDAVRVFSADADTVEAWAEGASEFAQGKLVDLFKLMPESILNLMTGSETTAN